MSIRWSLSANLGSFSFFVLMLCTGWCSRVKQWSCNVFYTLSFLQCALGPRLTARHSEQGRGWWNRVLCFLGEHRSLEKKRRGRKGGERKKKNPKRGGVVCQQLYVFLNFAWFQAGDILYSLDVEALCTEALCTGHGLSTFCVSFRKEAWRYNCLGFGEYLKILCSLVWFCVCY